MSSSASTSDVSSSLSTPVTSQQPSPTLANLRLEDISEEAKAEAAKLKGEANKAFQGLSRQCCLLLLPCRVLTLPTAVCDW